MYKIVVFPVLLFISVLLSAGCSQMHDVKRQSHSPDSVFAMKMQEEYLLKQNSPYLKAHMKNGNLYVLNDWKIDDMRQSVSGNGKLYNIYRDSIGAGNFTLRGDSVAIFESNSIKNSGTVTAFTIYTGISAAVTFYCLINPKACFGSCPTFYTNDGDSLRLQAEGFSSSIAPSMEATDIDALYHSKPLCDEYSVEMRNEALETHVIRSVKLTAVEKTKKGNRIYCSTDNRFWESGSAILPDRAGGAEGSCLDKLRLADGHERFSSADSNFLGEKEFLELDFRNIQPGNYGIVIGCRQTLLSTYLFYQTISYMGKDAAHYIAEIERNRIKVQGNVLLNMLGRLEVQVLDPSGKWINTGSIDEYGPLAADFHLIPIGTDISGSTRIRLKMTKGYWRVDYAAVVPITEVKNVSRIAPFEVIKDGKPDEAAKELLTDSVKALVTLPGDTYRLNFRLPSHIKDYELFLESRGYYLEWIRDEWMKEESPQKLAEIFLNPEAALRRMAPEFKAVEPYMERSFWRSKYAKP